MLEVDVSEGGNQQSSAKLYHAETCDRLKQNLHQTALALPEKARFHKVVSICAQGLVAAICLNLQSYPIQSSTVFSMLDSMISVVYPKRSGTLYGLLERSHF